MRASLAFVRVYFLSAVFLTLLVLPWLLFTGSAESKRSLDITFGTDRTTNIFPTQVETDSWADLENVLTQDLSDHALFQDFSARNSSYLPQADDDLFDESDVQNETNAATEETPLQEEATLPTIDSGTEETAPEEPVSETDSLETSSPEAEESEPVSEVTPVSLQLLLPHVATIELARFPLAQLTVTSSTESVPVDVQQEPPQETEPSGVPTTETSSSEAAANTGTSLAETTHDITLSNFDIAALEPGQFIDGMQLRVSFAAKLQAPQTGPAPYVDVLFGSKDSLQSVGVILLDQEVSNAVNGGYYLFALPSFMPVHELKEASVVLRYHGDKESLEGMFLDAAWLEMSTKVVTEEDLEERGAAEQLTHLDAPQVAVLVSEQLNFAATQAPLFNLRYQSQQNIIVRGFMKLIGRDSVSVEAVSVSHESIGDLPIEPVATMTQDGLLTLEVPESDLHDLRPGTYVVSIVYEENGFEYTDTFNFQWGILSLNPHQSEYAVGDTATISLGALSPNGNTLCDANLDLYVTDPAGFITKAPVIASGQCNGNNVVTVPDFSAEVPVPIEGEYSLYLERLDEEGQVIGFVRDSFRSRSNQLYAIERNGPTRIYPVAPYQMTLTVKTAESFRGTLEERVPADFIISSTSAKITQDGEWQVLTWDVAIMGEGTEVVSYGFDAPDISPYLYQVGAATLLSDEAPKTASPPPNTEIIEETLPETTTLTSSSTEPAPPISDVDPGTSTEQPVETVLGAATSTQTVSDINTENNEVVAQEGVEEQSSGIVFVEHRQWQIASDATGSMLLYWAGPTIPTGWTCVSCTGGDVFYQRFAIGSSTAGNNGGSATHGHTGTGAVAATGAAGVSSTGGGGADVATNAHTHTYTPTIATASNLPAYRHLVMIQHNSAGEPLTIPTGAIAVFDTTVPTGWTRYAAQDGSYIRGEALANIGGTGGSNTHTHAISGTTGAASAGTNAPGAAGSSVSTNNHTHTVSGSTASQNNEPSYIEVILGQLNATTTLPNDVITMWTDSVPSGWNNVSTTSQPFENRFIKPSATYGATGGARNHTPADVTGITSGTPSASVNRTTAGTSDATGAHTHSVSVTALSNTNHMPPYRSIIFGKRAGGAPPGAPTVYELFDNEKTGTSTPAFEFTASDTVGTDSILYQFEWDDDSDIAASPIGSRTSDVETGCSPNCFENLVTPADTSPFTELERVRFTIQTPLTDGTTYFYRIRAKKSIGDTWGSWSETYSVTYVADTDPSQWFQSEDAQFDKNVFDNTETYGSSSVRIVQDTPVEALVAYAEGTVQTPRYQIWDGSAWGGENSAQSVGGVIQWIKTVAGTKRDEYILATQDDVNDVNVQVYDGVADTWGDLQEMTTGISDSTRRGFDVAYETNSGDALVVYCDGDDDPAYRIWNGTNWSSSSAITTVSSNSCNYVSMASDPTSDEIILVTRDTGTQYQARVWTGTTWATTTTLGSMQETNNEGIAISYEESGGQALVVASNNTNANFVWTSWNGTEWSSVLTHALGNDFEWGVLKRDVGSDAMSLCYVDADNDIGFSRWDGEAWIAKQELELTGDGRAGRPVSCEYEVTTGRDGYLMVPYSDDANARYRVWDGSATTSEASVSVVTDSWEVGTVRTGEGKILAYFHDDTNTQYDFSYWNGTTWSVRQTLETSTPIGAAPFRQPIHMTAKTFQPAIGTVTSDPVDFDFVSAQPTWGEVTWSATEPVGSSVTIQMLYASTSTSTCSVLIPDAALSGNSTGFGTADVPLDISGLSTSTYNNICLRATIETQNESMPTLDDWTVSWERQPFLVQTNYRWYVNANSENPSDAWPAGATDLLTNETIPQEYSPGVGDILRLRLTARTDNAPLTDDSQAFRLQYAQESTNCASSTAWYTVGATGSTTALWRGYNNLLAFDGSTLSTLLLGADKGGTYEEENDSAVNPNVLLVGEEMEWDWVLEHNGALDGVQYCFRMIQDDGTVLSQYDQYPTLVTNASPVAPTPEKLFDNEQTASTTPWFEFVTEDPEGEDVTYQIQIDNNYDFGSITLDRNSLTNLAEFENIVTPADKDPFTTGQSVRFIPTSALTNNTTYYWRVRGKDVAGSNEWGDWSTIQSFTVNTATVVTTWYQTEQEQFETNGMVDTETTVSDDVILTPTFLSGTTTSTAIDFDDKTTGNAWGQLSWGHNVTSGSITYRVEYNNAGEWELVPDSFLPGNSTGFTSSPISLLSLDPQVHNEIRVRANMTDSSGSPRLLDWKVEWGFAVEQPTLTALFDNEKTPTTTPTFVFNTTDPDSDDIEYEISWSTDNTFVSASTTMRSGLAAGFVNASNGGDTTPFTSGDTVQFKIQVANALTNNQTYWWRVRGRDPAGGNTWSVWSETRSFTVDTTVGVSTWFQTTDEQFETNTLSDVETTGSDSVEITSTIREAFTAYAEGTVQTPRYRIWNGSEWGEEATAVSVGGAIRFVETAPAPGRDEYIIATQDSTGRVRAQVYDGANDSTGDLTTIVTAVPNTTRRGFDVAYETTSGDALVVACDGNEATYKTWDGSNWSGSTPITLGVSANCNWIQLAADPTSNEIIMVARDALTGTVDYEAAVWNGSAWTSTTTMGSMSETADEGIAVEYEESGGLAVAIVSNGGGASFAWRTWNGSVWSAASTTAMQDDFESGKLVRDLGSDNMVFCSIDNDPVVAMHRWNGTTNRWVVPYTTIDLTGNDKRGRPFGCEFETTAGRDGYIMIPYSDTTDTRSQFFNGTALSGEVTLSTIQDTFEIRTTRTGDGNILAMFYDDVNTEYDFSYWDGTQWLVHEILEGTAITTTNPPTVPFDIVARRYPTFTTGTVVSSPIDFDDGSGLKWQAVTLNDTTPASSTIRYQIEYYNGSTWQLIPDSALSGNAAGIASSSINISQVSRITYNTIRLKANLACSGGDCPTLNDWSVTWAAGINVSGTIQQYNQTASTTSGTVAVAVNGALQSGKTAAISGGVWSIPNVTVFSGDVVTLFVSGASDSTEAVAVTRYDGDGDITNVRLYEHHLTLGSNDATTTPLTHTDIGLYDFTNTEDIFFNVSASTLTLCATTTCGDARLYVRSGVYFTPGGRFVVHDFQNNGVFTAGAFTHQLSGSWDNNATSTMTGSTVVLAATSSSETVDSTGAASASFNNLTFGTTTGAATWSLSSALDVDGTLTVARGTLARNTAAITVAGNLSNESNGLWTGVGTTTFDGNTAATWRDQNASLQNVGRVLIDGTSKAVTLAGNVAAQSIRIGANDTLDAAATGYDITVYGNWINANNFIARTGEVFFTATTSGKSITTSGDAFYDLTFSGAGGTWSFTEATTLINNDFEVATGTVTLPTATTTIAGSFLASGGAFVHNNGAIAFTSSAAETLTFGGGAFTNVAYNLYFSGSGSWTVTDTHATSTNDVIVRQGTFVLPNGVFAIGGTLRDSGGSYTPASGTLRFYSSGAEVLTAGGSSYNDVIFNGAGSWSFTDASVSTLGDVTVSQGTLTLPTTTFTVAGSYDNNATVVPGTGTVRFAATTLGNTVDFGASALYNVVFDSATGGWSINAPATTTNNFALTSVRSFTLSSGQVLSVGGQFSQSALGASTTWSGATLSLEAGTYGINSKSHGGDTYGTLRVDAGAQISLWNSSADSYAVNSSASLYSQDHAAVDGSLYIYGAYTKSGGFEYWSYTTDFDGTSLSGTPRQAQISFADGASAAFTNTTVAITGTSSASTTISNQGSGTYTLGLTGGSLTANYYEFADLGSTGLSLLGGVAVPTLEYGSFTVAQAAGTALTISSSTIDASPAKQLYFVHFATSTAIGADNVTQIDGTPSSFWWFRSGTGNLYGEAFDNDTGNPGSIRFDDSSLVISIEGTVYSDGGVTPLSSATCDDSTPVVKVVVNGGASYTGPCSSFDGSFNIPGVSFVGDPTITVYLDNAPAGEKASAVTRTATGDITNFDLYANRVIVRHEDVDPLTTTQLATYDYSDDTDLRFVAEAAPTSSLRVMAGNELHIFASSTFSPQGSVTLAANAGANSYDGTLFLATSSTFTASGTNLYSIGGRLVLLAGAHFAAASSTVEMVATTSGKSITAASQITFHDLTFSGSGGSWNLGTDIRVDGDMTVTTGSVTGTGDVLVSQGSLTGNGTLSLGAGTTTLSRSNTFGGTTPWTFYNLELGDGSSVGTTTVAAAATTTVAGLLKISAAHFLDAGATAWDLSGSGTVFNELGTFLQDTSTVRYSGGGANVRSTSYYNLSLNAGAGSPTYTAIGLGIIIENNLAIGGSNPSTFDLNTNDPALAVNGSVLIRNNGTLGASGSGSFTIAGDYTNDGTFVGNSGTLTFGGTGVGTVLAGASSFANVRVAKSGGSLTIGEHATSTGTWSLLTAPSFSVTSGAVLAVGNTFFNAVGGGATTWSGSTLRLYGNGNYSLNAATTSDSYDVLSVDGTTQVRMWSSDASTYDIDSTASLYSQDHAASNGDLAIWGSYRRTSGSDYWSYATDFDGVSLGGSPRKVDVLLASGASVTVTGGSLAVVGTSSASTTLQNQGSGTYALKVTGTASTTWRYYEVTDSNSTGLELSGSASVKNLSFGTFAVSQTGGSGITVGGSVITQNPAKNFTKNRFMLDGVGSGVNVTATGTSVSSWRFANHSGDLDGEANDVDPNGDPGYIAWDDSAALITISGTVFSDEGSTVSSVCDGLTDNITLQVAGITSYNTVCDDTTGEYTFNNISYGPSDSLVVYIDGETEKGAIVTKEPISNINGLDIYEERVIVRHESSNPISIVDLSVWDSSDDADIPFTAVDSAPDTLTLPANRKLIVWTGKQFEPDGDVTLSGGGAGASHDGTLQLQSNASWNGQNSEALSIGGSFTLDSNASFTASNGTTTFTTSGAGRTITVLEDAFTHVVFNGSGSWSITDTNATMQGNLRVTAGSLTLPTGTTSVAASLRNTGGSIDANDGAIELTGSGTHRLTFGGSTLARITMFSGTYNVTDAHATTSDSLTILGGTLSLPSSSFSIGGNFENISGTITHNNGRLKLTNPTAATLRASSSDLFAVTFAGPGLYTISDEDITFLDDFMIASGTVTLASGTLSVGGSFDAAGGNFLHASGTVLFNSADLGETIAPGLSNFYAVLVGAPTGGYTLTGNATTTNNFTLSSAANFVVTSGITLKVGGVFTHTALGANTNWNGSTLALNGQNNYTINTKVSGADRYGTLWIGQDSDIRMWNSSATTTSIHTTASLYSQDHNAQNGALYIYGDFHIATSTEYWSYATDFDGASLSGTERAVTVSHAQNATTTVDGGTLALVGASGNETSVTNQGSGTYALSVLSGTLNAQYYELRALNQTGLLLSGTPTISSLSFGDFELALNGGSLITIASTTLNANASLVSTGNRFATSSAISGTNVTLLGTTSNAWTFVTHTGNLDGETYDDDGIDACGSIRWADSACLITQQTAYRWRNDDGGLNVPNSEWFNSNWDARQSVSIDNSDSTSYVDAAVKVIVPYDSDMQADFEDLRFTDSDGVTVVPHWLGSTTNSVSAEVWVKVPSLPAEDSARLYMYYYNPTATTTSSSTGVFSVADDFEDGNFSEYSGQTTLFSAGTTFVFDGTYGLDNAGDESSRANLGGIYRLDQTISQGETIRFKQYVDTTAGSGDETCTKFGIQSPGSANDNYAICLEQFGTDRISLVKDAVDNDTSGVVLASSTVTYATGWYEVEVDWGTDDSFAVALYDSTGSLTASFSDTDSTYTSGGFGFSFWFHNGGWDSISSRPTLETEPVVRLGAKQGDGGASFKAALNSVGNYNPGDIARLRLAVENSGLAINDQEFILEYAPLGGAPSCESVSGGTYQSVPTQASCGSSPVCMQASSQVANGASTADLLLETAGTFTLGQYREDPTNITSALDILQNEYTELEYVITPTSNTVDDSLCFRVTNNGSDLDTYLRVAQMALQFDPVLGAVTLNNGLDITLLPGATTTIYATTTVTDLNGYADIELATTTFYRGGVGAACTADNNNCYVSSDPLCAFTNCSGDTCVVECYADIYFHAEATDVGSAYDGEEWFAFLEVEDGSGGYDFETSIGTELSTLRAIDVEGAISYGSLSVGSTTGATNASTSIENQGNVEVNIEIEGTDMSDGGSSFIPAAQQKFSTSTFSYAGCGSSCMLLSSTTPFELDVDLAKPTVSNPAVTDEVYWGIAVPFGVNSAPHQGINVFTPVGS